jgi:hypothetical protein
MDKKIAGREILYRRGSTQKKETEDTPPKKNEAASHPEPPPKEVPKITQPSSAAVWDWLEVNKKYIKTQGICSEVGIDAGNFSRLRKAKAEIPSLYLSKIIETIKKLGYAK